MRVQQGAFVSKQPIGQYRAAQVHEIQDIQVHILRDIAADQAAQKRRQRQARHGDKQADRPVKGPVQLEQGTDGFRIILRNGLVHAENHRAAYAQFGQIQEGKNGFE